MRGLVTRAVARALSHYKGVETPGEVEICTGGHEDEPILAGLGDCGTARSGEKGAETVLASILLKNVTTGGTGIDGLL